MKGGSFLVLLFLLFCFLWGVSSIFGGIRKAMAPKKSLRKPSDALPPSPQAPPGTPSAAAHVQELQALFALHQSGALTRDEFEKLKQKLLKLWMHITDDDWKEVAEHDSDSRPETGRHS